MQYTNLCESDIHRGEEKLLPMTDLDTYKEILIVTFKGKISILSFFYRNLD